MNYTTIAETQNYIVLDDYTKLSKVSEAPTTYQSEHALELLSLTRRTAPSSVRRRKISRKNSSITTNLVLQAHPSSLKMP